FFAGRQVKLNGQLSTLPLIMGGLDDVRKGIDLIKRQGEGTAAAPFEASNPEELAHFYQFGELAHGRRLTRTAPFTYTGEAIEMPGVRGLPPGAARGRWRHREARPRRRQDACPQRRGRAAVPGWRRARVRRGRRLGTAADPAARRQPVRPYQGDPGRRRWYRPVRRPRAVLARAVARPVRPARRLHLPSARGRERPGLQPGQGVARAEPVRQ